MKKLLVLFILSIFLLSGCGIYNLIVLPDDAEYIALVQELDNPEKIGNYMLDNFTYEIHLDYDLTPYQLYELGKGDCADFASFGIFIANYHGYETYQILIYLYFKEIIYCHSLAIYKEDEYNYSSNQNYYSMNVSTFKEVVDDYFNRECPYGCELMFYIVYDYNMNIVE